MALKNETKTIFDQYKFIYDNYKKFSIIQLINYPSLLEENTCLGVNVKPSFAKYENEFYKISTCKKISILLSDDSIINLNYIFDQDGFVIEHHLSYLPNPLAFNLSIEEIMSKYIRFDFENEGYTPKTHSLIHLHIGRYKSLRIPLTSFVTPIQFLSFILLFYYNIEYKEFSKHLKNNHMRTLLKEDESGFFVLNFIDKKDD